MEKSFNNLKLNKKILAELGTEEYTTITDTMLKNFVIVKKILIKL